MVSKPLFISAIFIILAGWGPVMAQKIFQTTNARIEFFSSAPVEDIRAFSDRGIVVFSSSGEISFKVPIRSFNFPKSLMQEHFNENYMESDKFPSASFKGRIDAQPDLSKVGDQPVTLQGVLEIHGVKQSRKIFAILSIKEGVINLKSNFEVTCADHQIKIPRIFWKNIAEVVLVEVNANFK